MWEAGGGEAGRHPHGTKEKVKAGVEWKKASATRAQLNGLESSSNGLELDGSSTLEIRFLSSSTPELMVL